MYTDESYMIESELRFNAWYDDVLKTAPKDCQECSYCKPTHKEDEDGCRCRKYKSWVEECIDACRYDDDHDDIRIA